MSYSVNHASNVVTSCILENNPYNNNAVRIALLGGQKVGKTTIALSLSSSNYRETYYPTYNVCPELFTFIPERSLSRRILDDRNFKSNFEALIKSENIVLSKSIYEAYSKGLSNVEKSKKSGTTSSDIVFQTKNDLYLTYSTKKEQENKNYVPPHVTPILVELVDTPAFNPEKVVPFLESSLYNNLGPEYLRNLSKEPRLPVSTNPILVASGASELNGSIDGYFFVYSAIPDMELPSYDDIMQKGSENLENLQFEDQPSRANTEAKDENRSFRLLENMKTTLDEAWAEYLSFKTKWDLGKESDSYSMKLVLKNMWKDTTGDFDSSFNPFKLGSMPPVWIICTHINSPSAYSGLVSKGKQLAQSWGCGFYAIDCKTENIEACLALMIKDIVASKKDGYLPK